MIEQLLDGARVHPALVHEVERHSGSIAPQRVPIGSPSRAVKPIVLATLAPPGAAHMLAPLPRCSDDRLAPAPRASSNCGSTEAMYSYESPWKP